MSNETSNTEQLSTEDNGTDWKAHARKWEARAKAHKEELDELRPKLQQYESAMSTSETDVATLKAQVSELTAKAAANEREALVARVARDHGISDTDDIRLFLTGADEEALTAQAARLATHNAASTEAAAKSAAETERANAIVPTEGQPNHTPREVSPDEEFAAAIQSALGQAQALV